MPIIILIPTVICIFALFRVSVQRVFLGLYIPIFMMIPIYYFWKVVALPPVDLSEAILLPLGIAIFAKEIRRWRFAPMDFWVVVFIFTTYYADALNNHSTASTFDLFDSLCTVLVPYMAGKLLIEYNGMRAAVIKRMLFCLFLACLVSTYEYRMGQNPFSLVMARFFPEEHFPWKTQIRWGFGRVSGPFGQSELAGMMLFFGLVMTLWLSYNHLWEPKFSRAKWLPGKKSAVIAWTIGIVLLMTQARGPWIGTIAAVPIALIGRARRVGLASVLVAVFLVVGGSVAYVGLKSYANADVPTTSSEQENAQYRAELLDHYIPVAQAGGAWGWGQDFPRVGGQGSIDNEYLFVALTQGWVGLLAFCMIALETLYYTLYGALYNPTQRDRYFSYSLMGVFVGLLITIATVFLGNQPYQLFFLLAGWSQAARVKRSRQPELMFEQVYT
jgi:O-Antigen ligase